MSKKIELTADESAVYMKIVAYGTMDDMFEIGYAIGRARFAEEQLTKLKQR